MSVRIPRRDLLARGLLAALALVGPLAGRRAHAAAEPKDCPTRDCGWIYDPAVGDPEHGVAPGLAFEDLPDDWACPNCGRIKQLW